MCATCSASATCVMWSHDGYMTHEDTVRCIELLGSEVLPALRADGPAAEGAAPTSAGVPAQA